MPDRSDADPCPKSPDGSKPCCWHDDLTPKVFLTPFQVEICCHCGEKRSKHAPGTAIRDHGPHLPDIQIITTFRRDAELIERWQKHAEAKQRRDEEHAARRIKHRGKRHER